MLKLIVIFITSPFSFFLFLTELNRFRVVFSQRQLEQAGQITCNRSHAYYDLCSIDAPTLLEPITSTLYALDPINCTQQPIWLKTRPYPRKWDEGAMSKIKELTLTSAPHSTQCKVTHNSPALVFSAGGYTGNFFHDFSDGFVPLFITINSHFYNQDVILVISDCNDLWWPQKYAEILSQFSHHPIIDIKKERVTHCFPSAIIGLINHGPMIVDPTLLPHHPKSLTDFRIFQENSYNKKGGDDVLITSYNRPHLVFVIRKPDVRRAILNKKEVIKAVEEVGFDVNVLDPTTTHTSLAKAFKLVHSSHAMLGVHGAGLTHMLFLRPRAVLVQVVPIGVDSPSNISFKGPTKNLGLEYMDYKVKTKESSLAEIYGANDLVLKNPDAYVNGNYSKMRVYMRTQNLKLDIVRFKRYLVKVYKKAKKFMDMES